LKPTDLPARPTHITRTLAMLMQGFRVLSESSRRDACLCALCCWLYRYTWTRSPAGKAKCAASRSIIGLQQESDEEINLSLPLDHLRNAHSVLRCIAVIISYYTHLSRPHPSDSINMSRSFVHVHTSPHSLGQTPELH
jgi:hypothetical protein